MRITHDRICIRNAEQADCGQLAAWWNDGRVMAHAGFPLGLNTTAGEIGEQLAEGSDDAGRILIIECEGRPVGEMNYRNLGSRTAEIGIKICEEDYQNRGLGRICLSMLIGRLFGTGYARIVLDTNLKNLRAQHVYESLGCRKLRVSVTARTSHLGEVTRSVDSALMAR